MGSREETLGSPFSRARVYFAGIAKIRDYSQSNKMTANSSFYNGVLSGMAFEWKRPHAVRLFHTFRFAKNKAYSNDVSKPPERELKK